MNISRDFRDEKEEIAVSQRKSEEKPDPNYRRLQSCATPPQRTPDLGLHTSRCRSSHLPQVPRQAATHIFQALSVETSSQLLG